MELPSEGKVKILTNETNDWVPLVAQAVLDQKTCIIPTLYGPYIIIAGILAPRFDRKPAEMINAQKSRPLNQNLVIGIPPAEIPYWVDYSYRDTVETIVGKVDTNFGVIAPASERVPRWLQAYDNLHRVWEKMFVWSDSGIEGPIADCYKCLRGNFGISPEEFFLVGSSANLHSSGRNFRFRPAYEQLGETEGIEYAVADVREDERQRSAPPILSILPLTRGREKFLVFTRGGDLGDLKEKFPSIVVSERSLAMYFILLNLENRARALLHR